ncbi:MAG TPA: hypothetical protein VFR41_00040, partial [Acidimicrobiia bacterium]|nr:hypothetical protein [Acidimicrobiia bacterium]
NIFLETRLASDAMEALPNEIVWSPRDVDEVAANGQVRVFWDDTPIDLFFTYHLFHEQAEANTDEVPFLDTRIPILGATELAVFKAFFNRTKDWADIEAMYDAGSLDIHEVIGWMVDLLGPDDHRVLRLRDLLRREPPTSEPRFMA